MVFGKYEKFQITVACICVMIVGWAVGQSIDLIGAAIAQQITSPNSTGIALPDWIWTAIVTGAVAGATTYGMVKVKLDWLFDRLIALETVQRRDSDKFNDRLNDLLMSNQRRRESDIEPRL